MEARSLRRLKELHETTSSLLEMATQAYVLGKLTGDDYRLVWDSFIMAMCSPAIAPIKASGGPMAAAQVCCLVLDNLIANLSQACRENGVTLEVSYHCEPVVLS